MILFRFLYLPQINTLNMKNIFDKIMAFLFFTKIFSGSGELKNRRKGKNGRMWGKWETGIARGHHLYLTDGFLVVFFFNFAY